MISSKLPQVGTTIFTVMSALAREHNAINLSQGFPDFDIDPDLARLLCQHAKAGHNQYAPMPGLPVLREAIAEMVKTRYGAAYDPEKAITVTSGATEALFCAITALIREGDEVIVIEPAYDSYIPAIQLSGGVPVCMQLSFPDYKIDWERLKKLVNHRTRAIILNFPHNPSAAVWDANDVQQLEKIIGQNDIFIISDEVWEHIVFDGARHESVARYPALAARSFIIGSFGKALNATGWKIGYCLAPEALSAEFRKVHQYVTFCSSAPHQYAIASYLQEYGDRIYELSAFYQARRDSFLRLMAPTRFKPLPSRGTYFQLMRYDAISDEPDVDFARRLTTEYGVATIPVSVFYRVPQDHKVLRFCFAKSDDTLAEAARRLSAL